MKKQILIIVSIIFISLFLGCSESSNSNDSYNSSNLEETQQNKDKEKYLETIEFIKSKPLYENDGIVYFISINNCILETGYTIKRISPNPYIQSVSLEKLNPNIIKVVVDSDISHVDLYTTGEVKLVSEISGETGDSEKSFSIRIDYKYENDARRVAKAFKYLIEYCGGKDEMY